MPKLNNCKKCGADTLLPECAKCLRGEIKQTIKKSNNNIRSIMDIHKLKVIKYSKNPSFIDLGSNKPKNRRYTWATTTEIIDNKFLAKNNWGIICNKKSGVMGVDLDTHKWQDDNLFYKTFGKDFIKKFNTYTQKTPNGGYHLVFLYDKDLNQTESKLNSKFGKGIDIRNGHEDKINAGGYLLGAGSVFKKKDGTIAQYKIINDVKPAKIDKELKKWLLDNIYNTIEKTEKTKKDFKKQFNIETEILDNTYNYYITEEDFKRCILQNIKKTYLEDFKNWLILSSAMKQLNFKDLWHKFSAGSAKYNFDKNEEIWHNIKLDGSNYYVEYIFKNCYNIAEGLNPIAAGFINNVENAKLMSIIKYKPMEEDKIKADITINRAKLSKCKNEEQEKKCHDPPIILNLEEKGGFVIKSDTGTGKTTLLKDELFKSGQKFISIVSRVSLGKEQYQNFNEYGINCKFYANCWPEKGDSIITTIDSLLGCGKLMKDIGQYTLFIDEFNSVLEYIMQADTCLSKVRAKIWKYLIYILLNCKNFVCVDADISDMSIKFLEDLKLKYKYINNVFKHNKGVEAIEFFNLAKFIDEIKKNKKYIVCCDSKKSAEFIFLETGKTAKLLTSATDKLNDETLDDYDQIIFSPAIIYGLDSSMQRPVFVYHKESTISPKNMLQQVARCRNIEKLYYCFQKQKFMVNNYHDSTEAKEYIKEIKDITEQEFDILDEEETARQIIFNNLYIEYIYKQDIYNTNKYIHFKILLEKRGFVLTNNITMKTDKPDEDIIKAELDKYKIDNFDIESAKIKEFNEKYLGLTDTQLLSIKDLFLKEQHEITAMFSIKKYFSMGIKNMPLFDKKKQYNEVKEQDWAKDINKDQLANYYDYETSYNALTEQEEIKIKKLNTSKFKFYLIDKLKVMCDYNGTVNKGINNTIMARKMPKEADLKKWLKFYKIAFNYRGKHEPQIKTKEDCEKFLFTMLKKTFGAGIYDKKKIRVDKDTKTLYFLNSKFELLKYAQQITQYQRINKFKNEISQHKESKYFIKRLCEWQEDDNEEKGPFRMSNK